MKCSSGCFLQIPLFFVEGMESGVVYRFIIYSVNDKGRSEPFILDGITFSGVAKLTSKEQTTHHHHDHFTLPPSRDHFYVFCI